MKYASPNPSINEDVIAIQSLGLGFMVPIPWVAFHDNSNGMLLTMETKATDNSCSRDDKQLCHILKSALSWLYKN